MLGLKYSLQYTRMSTVEYYINRITLPARAPARRIGQLPYGKDDDVDDRTPPAPTLQTTTMQIPRSSTLKDYRNRPINLNVTAYFGSLARRECKTSV